MTKNIEFGGTYTYDDAFESRASADLTIRFGSPKTSAEHKEAQKLPVVNSLTASPGNRDVRVHDCSIVYKLVTGCELLQYENKDAEVIDPRGKKIFFRANGEDFDGDDPD